MVNFIKSRPLKSRLFTKLCEELKAKHLNFLLHTEARWLSRGKVLSRVCELKEEMLTFFTLEQQEEFCDLLADDTWCAKLSYLADIFGLLNKLTLMEKEKLVELRHDRDLKLLHMQLSLDEFWVQIMTKYPHVAKKALVMLIQFSTSYQCELGFSALANIKTNKRERLKTLEEEIYESE
ncbi:protein FAM200A-like [Palaemon carinicauda]|uniref:protein FAM200A-like n=1 Tax=Palaemon carinicauda TaxID=392227 RepID=UPI0035B5D62F